MSDKTNDEKLIILQERLAEIKQKNDIPISPRQDKEVVIEIPTTNIESPKKEKKPLNFSWIIKSLIVASVAYGIFYGYTNFDFNALITKFSSQKTERELAPTKLEYKFNLEKIESAREEWIETIDWDKVAEGTDPEDAKKMELKKSPLKGGNIAIISTSVSILDESSAKAIVNNLKVKGFTCNYFYLPENSNSTNKVYQIFIGPYENEEETNQWAKNLETEFNIITL